IGFDPMNTLAMCLVGEELLDRPNARFADFSFQHQVLLHQIYTDMVRALPGDPTAERFVVYVERAREKAYGMGAKRVLTAVVETAQENSRLPERSAEGTSEATQTHGDQLANL